MEVALAARAEGGEAVLILLTLSIEMGMWERVWTVRWTGLISLRGMRMGKRVTTVSWAVSQSPTGWRTEERALVVCWAGSTFPPGVWTGEKASVLGGTGSVSRVGSERGSAGSIKSPYSSCGSSAPVTKSSNLEVAFSSPGWVHKPEGCVANRAKDSKVSLSGLHFLGLRLGWKSSGAVVGVGISDSGSLSSRSNCSNISEQLG